tara:strand:+ start:683 stop:1030 length:348 start_codon:yes stop_codon:yes gene_type:complete
MRDKRRKEKKLLEDAYQTVNEMNMGIPANPYPPKVAIAVPIPGAGAPEGDENESCGSVEPDISALAAQAIAAITELATAAGANISVTVETQQEEVHEVDVPIDQFNTGYEDVEDT